MQPLGAKVYLFSPSDSFCIRECRRRSIDVDLL